MQTQQIHPYYDAGDVKKSVSALQVAQDYGHVRMASHNQSNAQWRGGDNPTAVLYNDDGTFKDFVSEAHGDAIDLYMLITGASFVDAVNALGDRYCPAKKLATYYRAKEPQAAKLPPVKQDEPQLQPPPPLPMPSATITDTTTTDQPTSPTATAWTPVNLPKSHYDELISKGFKVVKEWPYCDRHGKVAYYVVRLENDTDKEILQRAADGTWGIKEEKRLLYNLPSVIAAQKIYIVEGEKCADAMTERGFVATTVSGGAGKGRWKAEFNEYFRGKDVVILTDADEKGVTFGKLVAAEMLKVAKTLKVFSPCKDKKQDIADYFHLANHTAIEFEELEKATPFERPFYFGEVTPQMVEIAKERNETPFQNYREEEDEHGRKKKIPIAPMSLLADFFARFLNFPCLLGQDILFDHDRDTKEIKNFSSCEELFAWISVKTKQNYNWLTGNGCISKKEFYFAVKQNAHRFELISETPDYPRKANCYYLHPELPLPSKNHETFLKLIDFFSPSTNTSKVLLKALFIAPMWYKFGMTRPSWVIDSANGKGVGKSTIYRKLSLLYKCTPIQVNRAALQRDPDELDKRLVSNTGRKSKFFVMDNVVGAFQSDVLARYITSDTLSGRAPYSAGEDSRPNNLTYIFTGNGLELDGDLTSRSYFIKLKTPDHTIAHWEDDINGFIEYNRWQIFADMIDILQTHEDFGIKPASRHDTFEREVVQAVCADVAEYQSVMEAIKASAESANTDQEEAQRLENGIRYKIVDTFNTAGFDAQNICAWIQSDVLKMWTQDICGHSISAPAVRQFAIDGYTDRFDKTLDRFPSSSSKHQTRGVMWLGENADRGNAWILRRIGRGAVKNEGFEVFQKKQEEGK